MNRLKNFKKILRGRAGTTLVELIVSAVLLCLLLALSAACLEPAARVTRLLREQNEAQTIADDLLITVKSEIEDAQGYVKCYASADPYSGIGGQSGVAEGVEGEALEFLDENGYAILLSTGGTCRTELRRKSDDQTPTAVEPEIEPGCLVVRYYSAADYRYQYWEGTTAIARALTKPYGAGFYMGLRAKLSYTVSGAAVTVRVRIFRDADMTQQVFSDELVVDLRYAPPLRTAVTAAG